eukprot:TRINITY_DN36818_c0_g1_i1.p1 TRINITY_DN36818_c0_g1~~TRINITY_DN36818_c0_g1_i1.p1  ORF type:complete len:347 (-),score=49.22 TRINITY_DN36818_c0_g1_i1:238-1278(-)
MRALWCCDICVSNCESEDEFLVADHQGPGADHKDLDKRKEVSSKPAYLLRSSSHDSANDSSFLSCADSAELKSARSAISRGSSLTLTDANADEAWWAQNESALAKPSPSHAGSEHRDEKGSDTTECPSEDAGKVDAMPCFHARWWSPAELSPWTRGPEPLATPAKLLCTQVVKHRVALTSSDFEVSWQSRQSEMLYEEMGAKDPSCSYLAVWLKLDNASLVSLSALPEGLAQELGEHNIGTHLKLLLNPVHVALPFPTKGAKEADTIGSFFGKRAIQSCKSRASCGAEVTCVQIDLYSNWMLRIALKQVGFRLGNTLELILVDWPCRRVVSAIRLAVTEDFLKLLA